jgi:hypothetical protein
MRSEKCAARLQNLHVEDSFVTLSATGISSNTCWYAVHLKCKLCTPLAASEICAAERHYVMQ